eukprot:12398441-Karenia_brevis.AAC.1
MASKRARRWGKGKRYWQKKARKLKDRVTALEKKVRELQYGPHLWRGKKLDARRRKAGVKYMRHSIEGTYQLALKRALSSAGADALLGHTEHQASRQTVNSYEKMLATSIQVHIIHHHHGSRERERERDRVTDGQADALSYAHCYLAMLCYASLLCY